MRFLLRMAFWLTVIAILLPRDGSESASHAQINAIDAMSAAKATVGDMRQFCERQPDACTVGSQAATALGDRAKAGAKQLYEFFNEKLNESDPLTTATPGPKAPAIPLPPPRPSQHTLTPTDVAPAWRGPTPRKDSRTPAA